MSIRRAAKQQPWYHQPLPRCDTETLTGERCIFSARYTDSKTGRIKLCKVHADMAVFKTRPIGARVVTLR